MRNYIKTGLSVFLFMFFIILSIGSSDDESSESESKSSGPTYTKCECKEFYYQAGFYGKNWSEVNTCVKAYVYNKEKGGRINTSTCLSEAWESGSRHQDLGEFAIQAWACDCE